MSYLTAVDLRLPKQRLHSADDAFKDVSRGWMLDLGDDAQIFVDEDGVGIGAPTSMPSLYISRTSLDALLHGI